MRKTIILILALVLGGCTMLPLRLQHDFIDEPCSNSGNQFDIGRYSFGIHLDERWDYVQRPWIQETSFHFTHGGVACVLNTDSYHRTITWMEGYWDNIDDIHERFLDFYILGGLWADGLKASFETRDVEKAGLPCVRILERDFGPPHPQPIANINIGALDESLSYLCVVPGQEDRRPIDIGGSQFVPRGRTPFDLDALLQPVFDSLELNPSPPPVPEEFLPPGPPKWYQDKHATYAYEEYLSNLKEKAARAASPPQRTWEPAPLPQELPAGERLLYPVPESWKLVRKAANDDGIYSIEYLPAGENLDDWRTGYLSIRRLPMPPAAEQERLAKEGRLAAAEVVEHEQNSMIMDCNGEFDGMALVSNWGKESNWAFSGGFCEDHDPEAPWGEGAFFAAVEGKDSLFLLHYGWRPRTEIDLRGPRWRIPKERLRGYIRTLKEMRVVQSDGHLAKK